MLSQETIFFGHQSVGGNIIQGIEDILRERAELQLNIKQVEGAEVAGEPALIHTYIGQNYDPMSKLQGFDTLMRGGIGGKADIAFFKFCYVDFNQSTDIDSLFASYKQTMNSLAKDYPQTTLVHVTVPLTAPGNGFKLFVKGILGRDDLAFANAQRHRFNELVRQEYQGKAPIFDLAAAESTMTNGQTCSMNIGGQTVPCLIADYTDDNEHLNEQGRKIVAEQLLAFLANMPQPQPQS